MAGIKTIMIKYGRHILLLMGFTLLFSALIIFLLAAIFSTVKLKNPYSFAYSLFYYAIGFSLVGFLFMILNYILTIKKDESNETDQFYKNAIRNGADLTGLPSFGKTASRLSFSICTLPEISEKFPKKDSIHNSTINNQINNNSASTSIDSLNYQIPQYESVIQDSIYNNELSEFVTEKRAYQNSLMAETPIYCNSEVKLKESYTFNQNSEAESMIENHTYQTITEANQSMYVIKDHKSDSSCIYNNAHSQLHATNNMQHEQNSILNPLYFGIDKGRNLRKDICLETIQN